MAEYIVMPKLGFDMREGVLVGWLKKIGDPISEGEVVAEIESDKATLELESHANGVLLATLEESGAVVPIGANLAILGEAGEDISSMMTEKVVVAKEEKVVVEEATTEVVASKESHESAVSTEYPGGVKATPVARRVASEHQLDLSAVPGSGPGGRIRKADVESFLERPAAQPAAKKAAATTPVVVGENSSEVPTTRLRQAIARRMSESKTNVPHFYVTTEIDMGAVMELRREVNEMLGADRKVSVNDLIVKAAAVALRDFPNLNASFAGDKLIRHHQINVGSAVAVEGGLLTVVQKNTDRTSLSQIAADHKEMITRARSGKIHPEDVSGSTFTVSNLGAFEVDHFIAIVNPPEAAILAIGSAKEQPVVIDGQLAVGLRMKATISADHRVTDGAEAAQYMQRLKAVLERPLALLV